MVDSNNRGTEFYEKIKNPNKKKLKWGFTDVCSSAMQTN